MPIAAVVLGAAIAIADLAQVTSRLGDAAHQWSMFNKEGELLGQRTVFAGLSLAWQAEAAAGGGSSVPTRDYCLWYVDIETEPEMAVAVEGYSLRPKPWFLNIATKKWQWVAIDPNIYYPPDRNPLEYPAIIEHEKAHLLQQREIGKYKWLIKYIFSKNFRLSQELGPIVVELANMPLEKRRAKLINYAQDLSGPPYHRAAASFEHALNSILAKASEMGIETE